MNKTPTHFRVQPKFQTPLRWNYYHWPVPNPGNIRDAAHSESYIQSHSVFRPARAFKHASCPYICTVQTCRTWSRVNQTFQRVFAKRARGWGSCARNCSFKRHRRSLFSLEIGNYNLDDLNPGTSRKSWGGGNMCTHTYIWMYTQLNIHSRIYIHVLEDKRYNDAN